MKRFGLFLRARMWYLIVTALFFAAAFLIAPRTLSGASGMAFILLVICAFAAVLLLGDSYFKNLLIIALLAGLFLTVAQPFACPMDEEYHFLRAFDLTNGRVLPAQAGGHVPAGYETYAERGRWTLDALFEAPSLWFSPVTELTFVARLRSASYLPFTYIPAALGIGLARLCRLPLVYVVWFGRLFQYLFYVAVCALAVSRTKKLRSIVFLAALSTGVCVVAGIITPDLPLIGCALLFVSICLHYCLDEDVGERMRTTDVVLLAFSAAMVASGKYFGYALILPLILFVTKERCDNKRRILLILAGVLLLMAALQVFALLRYRGSVDNAENGANSRAQLAYMLENPVRYLTLLGQDMLGNLYERLLGQHAYNYEAFAAIGALGALLPMLGALLAPDKPALEMRARVGYAAFGLIAAAIMQAICCTALYVSWTPVGESTIWSVQPRYTLPFYSLVMLAAAMPRVKNEIKNWPRLTGFLALLFTLNAVAGFLM